MRPSLLPVQFNWTLDNLKIGTEWIMQLDVDEYLTSESIEWLKAKLDGTYKNVGALENGESGLDLFSPRLGINSSPGR